MLEEGVATHRDIDVGMMAGAGLDPRRGLLPPFMKADMEGLDVDPRAPGERHRAPRRALRAAARAAPARRPGPPRSEERPGLLPLRAARRGAAGRDGQARDPRRRRDRVAGQRPDELDRPAGDRRPAAPCGRRSRAPACARWSSPRRTRCCSRRAPTSRPSPRWTRPAGASCWTTAHELLRSFGRSNVATIAAVNGLAFGGGCELAMACDVRIAAQSALFGQPEVKLGIIPGFGGTQRLPRLVGENKALEMNLVGDAIGAEEAYVFGLVNRVVVDHELLDTALAWARKLAGQAPLAVGAIKEVSGRPDLDDGIEAEKAGFAAVFASEDAARASAPSSASASRRGAGARQPRRDAGRPRARGRLGRRAHRRRHLGALRDPRLPLARHRAVGERRPDGGRPHRRLARGPRALLALLRQPLPDARGQGAQRRAPRAGRARAPRAPRRGRHPEHRHAAPPGGHARARRGPRDHRVLLVPGLRRRLPAGRGPRAPGPRPAQRAPLRLRRAAEARRRALRRVAARGRAGARLRAGRGRRRAAVRGLVARGPPDRPAAGHHARPRRRRGRRHPGPDAVGRPRRRQARRRRGGRARGAASPRSR